MNGNPVQDLVMQVDTVLYWHRVYEIILAEYEWKPCAGHGHGHAGEQVLYWHRVYKLFRLNMSGKPVQELVMQVNMSCMGTGFTE